MPNVCIMVTPHAHDADDGSARLIHVYEISYFAELFRKSGTGWSVWSHDGWTRVLAVETLTVTDADVVTDDDPTNLMVDVSKYKTTNIEGIRRTKFVSIYNNRNAIHCGEGSRLVCRDPTCDRDRVRGTLGEVMGNRHMVGIVSSYLWPTTTTASEFVARTLGRRDTNSDLILAPLPPGTVDPTETTVLDRVRQRVSSSERKEFHLFADFQCHHCERLLEVGETVNVHELEFGRRHLFCDRCLTTRVDDFATQRVRLMRMWRDSPETFHRLYLTLPTCTTCNNWLQEGEHANFGYDRQNEWDSAQGLWALYTHCGPCYEKVLREFTRESYTKYRVVHPFEIISLRVDPSADRAADRATDRAVRDTLRNLYLDLDPYPKHEEFLDSGSWGTYKCMQNGLAEAQMVFLLGDRLRYRYLQFHLANGMNPWFGLDCTRGLAKFGARFCQEMWPRSARSCHQRHRKEFWEGRHYKVMYYLLNSARTHVYVPYFDKVEIDFTEDRESSLPVSHYRLPFQVYRLRTASGAWHAGVGGLVLS